MAAWPAPRYLPAPAPLRPRPWHDARWDGTVCAHPSRTRALPGAVAHPGTARRRPRASERGQTLDEELDTGDLPPCVAERAGFMAPFEFTRTVEHPRGDQPRAPALRPTPYRHPAYSAACIPFRWLLADGARLIAEEHGIDLVETGAEDAGPAQAMGFDTAWVQDKRCQLAMLDTFSARWRRSARCVSSTPRGHPSRTTRGASSSASVACSGRDRRWSTAPLPGAPSRRCCGSGRSTTRSDRASPTASCCRTTRSWNWPTGTAVDPERYVVYAPEDHWRVRLPPRSTSARTHRHQLPAGVRRGAAAGRRGGRLRRLGHLAAAVIDARLDDSGACGGRIPAWPDGRACLRPLRIARRSHGRSLRCRCGWATPMSSHGSVDSGGRWRGKAQSTTDSDSGVPSASSTRPDTERCIGCGRGG